MGEDSHRHLLLRVERHFCLHISLLPVKLYHPKHELYAIDHIVVWCDNDLAYERKVLQFSI